MAAAALAAKLRDGLQVVSFRFQKSFRFDNVDDKVTDRASQRLALPAPFAWFACLLRAVSGCWSWWFFFCAPRLCAFPLFAQPSEAAADVSQRFAAPSKWVFRSFRTLRNTFRTHLHTRSKFEESTWRLLISYMTDNFFGIFAMEMSRSMCWVSEKKEEKTKSNEETNILCSWEGFATEIPSNTHKISGVVRPPLVLQCDPCENRH